MPEPLQTTVDGNQVSLRGRLEQANKEYPLALGELFSGVLDALHRFRGLEDYFYLPFLPTVSVIAQGLISLN